MTLTEKSIAKIAPAKDRAHFHDNQVTGFGLRVASIADGGRKSFFWRAKIGGQQKFCPLGEYPFVSVADARDAAKKLVGQAAAWRQAGFTSPDPFQKEKRVERASVPTFRELCESYIENYLRANALTPQRAEYDVRLLLKNHLSAWLDKPLDAITVDDMLTVKNACGKHRHMANSCVEFARRVYNWSSGSEDGKLNFWKCANPAKDVSLYPHGKTTARKRFLQPNELLRFGSELKRETHADTRDVLALLLATGARKSNVYSMRWADISFPLKVWRVPMSKSGEGYDVPLTDAALAVLVRRHRAKGESEWVFHAASASGHITDVKKRWTEFRKRANLPGVRLHDLRRTRGSYLAISGVSLQQIGTVLGHKSLGSTEIYAQLNQESIRTANEAADATMRRMMADAQKPRPRLAAGRG